MTDQHFAAVLLHLRILIVLLGFVVSILVAFAWEYLWRETKPASRVIAGYLAHIVAARIYELRKKRSEIKRVTDGACCDSRGASTVWLARWRRHSGLGKLVGRRRHRVELEVAGRIAGERKR